MLATHVQVLKEEENNHMNGFSQIFIKTLL